MTRTGHRAPVEPIEEAALARRYDFTRPIPSGRHQPRPDPVRALLAAFRALARRGVGPNAFGAPLAESPLTFLLDTIQDAVLVRRNDGTVVYRNRAAESISPAEADAADARFTQCGVAYERRRMQYREGGAEVVIEVISRVR